MSTKATNASHKHQTSSSDLSNQQLQTQSMAGQHQQEALASLFRSLSNLANGNNQQKQQLDLQPLNCQAPGLASVLGVDQNLMSSPNAASLANSIQSVMAAAVMQQQLVSEAINRHQQQAPPPPRGPFNASHQPDNLSAYLADQLAPASFSFAEQRQHQQPLQAGPSQTEPAVQFSAVPKNMAISSAGQQGQRINYCTICNKELCNKYFMKTHMLKMHGINLETEQSSSEAGDEAQKSESSAREPSARQDDEWSGSPERLSSAASWPSQTDQPAARSSKQPAKGKQGGDAQSAGKPKGAAGAKQATSVMNGFAGNSMGGVVCDICNKELCSKYFLKVHKQNTHGIVTDYQDAGQFVYPFVGPLAAPNAFLNPTMALNPGPNMMPFPSVCFSRQSSGESGPSGAKRARSAAGEKQPRDFAPKPLNCSAGGGAEADKPLDAFFGLAAQQQPCQLASPFESMGQMGALMCYGAMGPFGPAGISPTMIVEMILRNQHLFNRHTNNQPQADQGRARERDKNNNGEPKPKSGSKAKEANSSRYFTHYTEACPMCDRRFKSIKWLKTHMMNDHKQEIAAYMQMMVQSMCGPVKPGVQQEQPFPLETGRCLAPNFACAQLAAHQPQTYRPSASLCPAPTASAGQQAAPPQAPSSAQMSHLQALQDDQMSLIHSYVDRRQGPQRRDPCAMNLSSPESSQARAATLTNLSGPRNISPPSSAKTSPRSPPSGPLDDEPQADQLDLSLKFSVDSQSCDFLPTHGRCSPVQISEFSDDDCSSRSSAGRDCERTPDAERFSEANASQSV